MFYLLILLLFAEPPLSAQIPPPASTPLATLRSPIPPARGCEHPRSLALEIPLPSASNPQTLVTIHRANGCWSDSLAIWTRAYEEYRLFNEFDEGRASARLVRHGELQFLHLFQEQPAATHYWAADILLRLDEDGGLTPVMFDGRTPCGASLAPLGSTFDHSYGGSYSFDDDDFRFEWNIWRPDDPPSAPGGGVLRGRLSLQPAPSSQSGYRLFVEDCAVTHPD